MRERKRDQVNPAASLDVFPALRRHAVREFCQARAEEVKAQRSQECGSAMSLIYSSPQDAGSSGHQIKRCIYNISLYESMLFFFLPKVLLISLSDMDIS